VYLDRESQPPFDGLYENGGLYEDMHMACIRIRVIRLRLVNTYTRMGSCTYTGLAPSKEIKKSIKKSPDHLK